MNTGLVIQLTVLVKIINIQGYGIKSVSPQTMDFSDTVMHAQSQGPSYPAPIASTLSLSNSLSPLPLFLSCTTNVTCGDF